MGILKRGKAAEKEKDIMKKLQTTINDDAVLQAANKKASELHTKEAELLAQIEDRKQRGTANKSLMIELETVRKALALARQDSEQERFRAADRILKNLKPQAKKHAERTAKAVKVLAEAVRIETAFYNSLTEAGVGSRYRPAQWRIDRRAALIVKDFEQRWKE